MICHECGESLAPCFFNKSGTLCDACWTVLDMDRFKEARPKPGDRPKAPTKKLSNDRIGVICPHCDHKVMRPKSFFHGPTRPERCPKCLERYMVNTKEAK